MYRIRRSIGSDTWLAVPVHFDPGLQAMTLCAGNEATVLGVDKMGEYSAQPTSLERESHLYCFRHVTRLRTQRLWREPRMHHQQGQLQPWSRYAADKGVCVWWW